ncbi:ThiF family adenylyltransferase [Actinoplanes sp. N902-109]|uniref:HesA/MoeB/ThiF family protein n=1 Tax=Actinoplanes sp. (strain N902-109) TaxID=649831 RepID=UPI0003294951|nr:ThiF family adenylyltransferase [Actinoplanes sp. N902-109]AGL19086.1 UBA/THIF-type NAD/FAD binding protein [Actinoplanes sp. N902-109]
MARPRLKSLDCTGRDGKLVVSIDPRQRVELDDPDGHVRLLLQLAAEGSRETGALIAEFTRVRPEVPAADVAQALESLDGFGWIEDLDRPAALDDTQRERYFSNLAFFDAFTSLGRGREDIQDRLVRSHVLVLGAGGLGSHVVQHLAGLGVGRLTIVDFDVVDLRNFARQFTYTPSQLGNSKVHQVAAWVSAFDPAVTVRPVHRRVETTADVEDLLTGVDLVVGAIDQPEGIDLTINAACVAAGVPYIRGGLAYLQGVYWSVDPGRSACRQCLETRRARELAADAGAHAVTWPEVLRRDRVNRAIGPVAGMLGALVAMEVLRYLTGIVPPVSAATYQLVDFRSDCHLSVDAWTAEPGCPVCATAFTKAPR